MRDSKTHSVRFYSDPAELIDPLATFTNRGLVREECVVLVVPRPRLEALRSRLVEWVRYGKLITFEPKVLLRRVLKNGMPDRKAFRTIIQELREATDRRAVRIYGEGVDLLASHGNFEGACRLEELWNETLRNWSFPLHCAYQVRHFQESRDRAFRERLCALHDGVLPP